MSDIAVLARDSTGDGGAAIAAPRVRSYWRSVIERLRHDPVTLFFAALLLTIILAAVCAPWIAPFDPYKESIVLRLKPFGYRGHLLGTDDLGRDLLSRLIYGGRRSLVMGVLPVAIACMVGSTLGIVGGFAGGRVNTAIMRTMDVFYAFPSVLLAVAISGSMGGGVVNGMLALTLVFIPPICRIAETATTQVKGLDFIEAARASGAGSLALDSLPRARQCPGTDLHLHVEPRQRQHPVGRGLSFLGLGVRPPDPDWGLMLASLRQAIYVQPWVCAVPGAAIFVTSMCFNMVSDGLRAAMDVRL